MFFVEQRWQWENWKGNGPFSNKYGYIHHIIYIYIIIYCIYYIYTVFGFKRTFMTLHPCVSMIPLGPPDRKGHVRERSKVFLGGGKMAARPRPAPDFQWRLETHPNAHVGYHLGLPPTQ